METGWPGVPAGGGAASDVTWKSQSAAVYVAGPSAADRPALRHGRRSQLDSQRAGLPWGPGELAGQMPIGGSKGGTGGVSLASYRNWVRHEAAAFRPAQQVLPSPPPPPPRVHPDDPHLQGHSPRPSVLAPTPTSSATRLVPQCLLRPPPPGSLASSLSACSDPHLQPLGCCPQAPAPPFSTRPDPAQSVPQLRPGTSPQVETKTCELLAGSAHPEAVKVSRLGQSSVSRGFILTYTT